MRDKKTGKFIKTHGMCKTRLYSIWENIPDRCNNKNNPAYKDYGGRGIKCEWKSFKEFKRDMYKNYLEHCKEFGVKQTTIDRKKNNENYCKQNCRWATYKEQQNNRTNNHLITYKGKTLNITQWAEELNIKYGTLYSRINKYKMSIEKAFNK